MERAIDIKMLGNKAKASDMEKALNWLNASDPANKYIAGRNLSWLQKLSDDEREEFEDLWQEMLNSLWE